jgi:hypothetical protein
MAIIQCTQKLLKELKVVPVQIDAAGGALSLWHSNLLILDRRKCVLFTNDQTRYSFLFPGLKKPDFKFMGEIFGQGLFKCLLQDSFTQEQVEKLLEETLEIVYSKTSNRSVLGSMNDIAQIIRWSIYDEGGLNNTDIDKLHHIINHMPCGAIGYKFSVEALRELLT